MKKESATRACPLLPSVYGHEDACGLALAYAEGSADPVEVTEQCLEAAATRANVYISFTKERALMEAEAARARYRNNIPLSPLDGVPMGWKDLFEVKGAVTTAGSDLHRNDPPATTSSPLSVQAARAGLVCTGKLNTTEFAYSSIGVNPHYGTPVNPHGKEGEPRIPGGSSCGSAVAVASGILPLAMGTDTGGSIRIPSAFNGLTGFKPSVGRYNREGMRFLSPTLDTPGPLARSVRDVVVLDRIFQGDPRMDLPEPAPLKGRRFAVERRLLDDEQLDPAVRAALDATCRRLERAGAVVARREVPSFREAMHIISGPWFMGFECFTQIRPILDDPAKAARIDQRIRKRAEGTRGADATGAVRAAWARQRLRETVGKDLGVDILLVPTVGFGAPLLNDVLEKEEVFFAYISANIRLTAPLNLMDMPGVCMPAGVDGNGMPVSVCLYAPSGEDGRVLEAALSAEDAVIHQ